MRNLVILKTAFLPLTVLASTCDLTVNPDAADLYFPLPSRYAVVSDADMTESHPTTVMLPDEKTILAFWDVRQGGPCGPAAVSTDAGRTWTDISDRLPRSFREAVERPFAFRFVDPKTGRGRIRVFASYAKVSKYDWRGPDERPLAEAMPSVVSEDDGRTWKPLPPLGADFACVNCFSGAARLKDGSYLAIFSRGGNPNGWGEELSVMSSRSRDGGLTWEKPRPVAALDGVCLTEPTLCVSPDGGEVCCFMGRNWGAPARGRHHPQPSAVCRSTDGGATWTKPQNVSSPLAGTRHMTATLPDGRYVATFRRGNDAWGWVGDYPSLRDGSGKGGVQIRLFHSYGNDADCGNTGVHALKDGTVVAVSHAIYSPSRPFPGIVAVRFTTDEVMAEARNRETAQNDFGHWKPFEKTNYRPLIYAKLYGPFAQSLIYMFDPGSLNARMYGNKLAFKGLASDLRRATNGAFGEAESKTGVYPVEKFAKDRRGNAAVLVWTVKVEKDCRAKLRVYGGPAFGCWLGGKCLRSVALSDVTAPNLLDVELKAGENEIMALVANPYYLLEPPANAGDPLHVAAALSGVEFTCVDPGGNLSLKADEPSILDDLGEGF